MRHWGKDILLTRRDLIACGAGLVVAKAAHAGLTPTPHQTSGPFYPTVKPADSDADLTRVNGITEQASGRIIEVSGRVLSVKGFALNATLVEIWQADSHGRYFDSKDRNLTISRDENFQGYGTLLTGNDGSYRFRTIYPASYGSRSLRRTPHIHFRVYDKTLGELVTQMYFPDEPMNGGDALFSRLPGATVRAAVTARSVTDGALPRFVFDLVLA
jgi:protocatechuate 3,4-dioxygenase beta subunit